MISGRLATPMRSTVPALAVTILALCGASPASRAETEMPVAILTSSKEIYRTATDALTQGLRQRNIAFEVVKIADERDATAIGAALERIRSLKPRQIAAAGPPLASAAIKSGLAPVTYYLVPNALDADFLTGPAPPPGRVTGVPADVSPKAVIAWLEATGGSGKRIALLHSASAEKSAAALVAAARGSAVRLSAVTASRENFAAATKSLIDEGYNGVLMIPDAGVYNSHNVEHLLVWGVREKRCVWGFSDKLVKAGALAGIYADPADVGKTAAEIIERVLAGRGAAEGTIRYVPVPSRAINLRTSKAVEASPRPEALLGGVTKFGEQ